MILKVKIIMKVFFQFLKFSFFSLAPVSPVKQTPPAANFSSPEQKPPLFNPSVNSFVKRCNHGSICFNKNCPFLHPHDIVNRAQVSTNPPSSVENKAGGKIFLIFILSSSCLFTNLTCFFFLFISDSGDVNRTLSIQEFYNVNYSQKSFDDVQNFLSKLGNLDGMI